MAPKKTSKKPQTAPETQPRRSPRLSNLPPSEPSLPEPPKKKAKTTPKTPEPKAEGSKKTIIIEHCNQCKKSFKTRATQVKEGLEEAVEGVKIVVNPKPPRKGCFEIREENGETFVTLVNLKRPFAALKELDMEKVISDIAEKMK